MPATKTRRQPAREMHLRAASADESSRSVDAVVSTEGRVVIFDWATQRLIEEVLLSDGMNAPRSVPLLEDHRLEVPSTIGSARDFRHDNGQVTARLFFGSDERSLRAWGLVRDDHLDNVSVRYVARECEDIEPGRSRIVAGRSYTAGNRMPLRITTRWDLREVSLVPIGADPGATIRSLQEDQRAMSTFDPRPGAYDYLRNAGRAELAAGLFHRVGLHVHDPLAAERGRFHTDWSLARIAMRCCQIDGIQYNGESDCFWRALEPTNSTFADILSSVVQGALLQSYEAAEDTTLGWVRESASPNYLFRERIQLATADELTIQPQSGTAEETIVSPTVEGIRASRFSRMITIDEITLQNDQLGVILATVEQIAQAARRVRANLVYSLLLENPALAADSTPVFDAATHGNLGTAVFDAAGTALAAAVAAMAKQVEVDANGNVVCLNIAPTHLIVPPELDTPARAMLRLIELANTRNIILRTEPRLSLGVRNQLTKTRTDGSSTAWYLAGSPPSIEIAYLDGKSRPSIDRTALKAGRWGIAFTVQLGVGVAATGYKSIYKSSGAGA